MNQGYKLCVPHIPNIKWCNSDNSPTVDIPIKKAGGWEAHNIYRALIILRSIWAHVINSLFWLQKCMSIRYQFNSVGVVSFSSYLYYLDTWISLSSYVLLYIKKWPIFTVEKLSYLLSSYKKLGTQTISVSFSQAHIILLKTSLSSCISDYKFAL